VPHVELIDSLKRLEKREGERGAGGRQTAECCKTLAPHAAYPATTEHRSSGEDVNAKDCSAAIHRKWAGRTLFTFVMGVFFRTIVVHH